MSMPTKYAKLHEQAGAANTAFVTPVLDTKDFDYLGYRVQLAGGVAPAGQLVGLNAYDTDGTTAVQSAVGTIATGAGEFAAGIGPGCSGVNNISATFNAPLGAGFTISIPALGAGVSATLYVYGRRQHRGPNVHASAD